MLADLDLDRQGGGRHHVADRVTQRPVDPGMRQQVEQVLRARDAQAFKGLRRLGADAGQRFQPREQRKQRLGPAHPPISSSQASSSMTGHPAVRHPWPSTRARPGDHQIGLGADRARHLGPQRLGPRLGLGAGHLLQRAGEDDGLARDGLSTRPPAPRPAGSSALPPARRWPCVRRGSGTHRPDFAPSPRPPR
jgi:hypothetical protein